jgi:hypothetical protein
MRRLGRVVQVETDRRGAPQRLRWGNEWRRVEQVLDGWHELGRWWDGEQPRRFWRVEIGGVCDLSLDGERVWRVEVVWD